MIRQTVLSLAILIVACAVAWRIVHVPSASKGNAPQESADKPPDADKDNDAGNPKVKFTEAQRKNANLVIVEASPEKVKKMIPLFGKVAINEEHVAHITARFPGIVKSVKKRLGDKVEKGEVLATVESNESLKTYDIVSELAGTIVQKDASPGEFLRDDKSAFIVADLSTVWIDLTVYLRDFPLLREGQQVFIHPSKQADPISATISYLSPFGSETTQTMLARVVVPNPKGELRPGLFVSAEAALDEVDVPVAVKLSALQTVKDKTVVFVDEGDVFEAREVELGERDNIYVEIVSGVLPGDKYVVENSFVLKSELGKSDSGDND